MSMKWPNYPYLAALYISKYFCGATLDCATYAVNEPRKTYSPIIAKCLHFWGPIFGASVPDPGVYQVDCRRTNVLRVRCYQNRSKQELFIAIL